MITRVDRVIATVLPLTINKPQEAYTTMKSIIFALVLTLLYSGVGAAKSQADIITDGFTPDTAAYSARQILDVDPGSSSGIYWLDEQMGLGSPFEAYADMTSFGGGWTLGIVSLDSSPVSSFGITANTGTVSSPFVTSHTRNIDYLGVSQDAEFRYWIQQSGSTIFDGTYFGRFSDATPTFTTTTDTFGLNGQIDPSFDFHRPDRNYDVSVLIRESSTPAPRATAVPEPSSLILIACSIVPAWIARRRRNSNLGKRQNQAMHPIREVGPF